MSGAYTSSGMNADATPITISWFDTAYPDGPAFGDPELLAWGEFVSIFEHRREGEKDGCCFAAARFKLERDGRQVRRLKANLLARTAVALDIEISKMTGEIPPAPDVAVERAKALGWTCLAYTSHNHKPGDIRYRVILSPSAEITADLPAPEIIAEALDLRGALDESKTGAASLFFLPSCPYGGLDGHQTAATPAHQSMPFGWRNVLAPYWRPGRLRQIALRPKPKPKPPRGGKPSQRLASILMIA